MINQYTRLKQTLTWQFISEAYCVLSVSPPAYDVTQHDVTVISLTQGQLIRHLWVEIPCVTSYTRTVRHQSLSKFRMYYRFRPVWSFISVGDYSQSFISILRIDILGLASLKVIYIWIHMYNYIQFSHSTIEELIITKLLSAEFYGVSFYSIW